MTRFAFDRSWRLIGYALILAVIVLSLWPDLQGPPMPQGDKLNHVLAYLGLMNWFCQRERTVAGRTRWAVGLMALGIAIEFAQAWSGWRMYEPLDMVADALGIALGGLLAPPRGFDVYRRLSARFSP